MDDLWKNRLRLWMNGAFLWIDRRNLWMDRARSVEKDRRQCELPVDVRELRVKNPTQSVEMSPKECAVPVDEVWSAHGESSW